MRGSCTDPATLLGPLYKTVRSPLAEASVGIIMLIVVLPMMPIDCLVVAVELFLEDIEHVCEDEAAAAAVGPEGTGGG